MPGIFNRAIFNDPIFNTAAVATTGGIFIGAGRKARRRETKEEIAQTADKFIELQAPTIEAAIQVNDDRKLALKRADQAAFMLLMH